MRHFINMNTVEEIKSAYRTLAFQFHPDHGGDVDMMKDLNNQYEAALRNLDGKKFDRDDGKGTYTYKYNDDTEKGIMDVIDKLLKLNMKGVEITLIGFYVWVYGNTYPYRKELGKNGVGLTWHSKRSKYYYKPEWMRSKYSGASLNQLAYKYGARNFSNDDRQEKDATIRQIAS